MIADAEAGKRELLDQAISRQSLTRFAQRMDPKWLPAPHLQLIIKHLEALERRDIRKLAICMPPRHGKTKLVSQLATAWYLGKHPDHDVVLASHGSELSEINSRAIRDIVTAAEFPFPDIGLRDDSRAVGRWQTKAGGTLRAGSPSSGLNGAGYAWGVADDIIRDRADADSPASRKSLREWYDDVFNTRRAPESVQLLCGTVWNAEDILSDVTARPGWTVLRFPLISEGEDDPLDRPEGTLLWPARFGPDDVPSVERGEITSRSFAALYQQRPAALEGQIVHVDWLQYYKTAPPEFERIVCGVDAASKTGIANDFSCIVTVGIAKNAFYVLDVDRRKVEYPGLLKLVANANDKHHPSAIWVEDTSNAVAMIQSLRDDSRLPIVPVTPKGSKISRFEGISGLFESKRIFLPEEASWLLEFEREILGFPGGTKHDDQCDALVWVLSQAAKPASSWFSFGFGDGLGDFSINGQTVEPEDTGIVVPADFNGGVTNALHRLLG